MSPEGVMGAKETKPDDGSVTGRGVDLAQLIVSNNAV